MTDDTFLTQFERGTLDRSDWTHEAHVRMAWLYVARSETYRSARAKVRSGIKKLNAAFVARQNAPCSATAPAEPAAEPVAEVKTAGFHETITTAFVRLVASRSRPDEKFSAFRKRNPDLFDRKLTALFAHYSPDLLFSEEAKNKFAEPDREPLPKPWLAVAV
ncbi:MAG TPA: hypothetical protein VGE74_28560 [Gemmata sp.]